MASKICIIISGPTASGKSALAFKLAKQYKTSIISADSRQCFQEMDIGVAKPSPEDLEWIPHYFINSHSIHDEVNAKVFEEYALNAVKEIFQEHDTAILVGGTGLYIKAFTEGLDEIPEINKGLENELLAEFGELGLESLQRALQQEDPMFYSRGEMKNPRRMLRALAVVRATGRSVLSFYSGQKVQRPFIIQHRSLELPRGVLYDRINHRVDKMMEAGLLEEVKTLEPFKELPALQTVGYRELFDYFEGKSYLDKAVELIKQNTRHYAKRQMTWFKKHIPASAFETVTV